MCGSGLAAPAPTTVGAARFKVSEKINFKPRLTEIEDISKAKRKMKMTHFALDAV
jgi:hypothetical protein